MRRAVSTLSIAERGSVPDISKLEPVSPTQQKGFERKAGSPCGSTTSSGRSSSSDAVLSAYYPDLYVSKEALPDGKAGIVVKSDLRRRAPLEQGHPGSNRSSYPYFASGFWKGTFLAGCFGTVNDPAERPLPGSSWPYSEGTAGGLEGCSATFRECPVNFRADKDTTRDLQSACSLLDATVGNVDLRGKVVVLSGSASGPNLEIARSMCRWGAHVVLACHCVREGNTAAKEVLGATPVGSVSVMKCDLSRLTSVREFCLAFCRMGLPLHLLINTAQIPKGGYSSLSRAISSLSYYDHAEATTIRAADPTVCLGNFLLTELLLPTLQNTAFEESDQTRIINVSPVPLSTWESCDSYAQVTRHAGLSLALHAVELAKRWAAEEPGRRFCPLVTINACSPAASSDTASVKGVDPFGSNPATAVSCVYTSISQQLRDVSGQCFEGTDPVENLWSGFHMVETASNMYETSMRRVGLR